MTKLYRIDHEHRLYWMHCGEGFSALGFDYANRQGKAVAKWLKIEPPSSKIKEGTDEGYEEYLDLMDLAIAHHKETGKQCNAELTPQLKGLEGLWVWVEDEEDDDEARIFKVGKSTGWMPCHLEIMPPDFTGGISASKKYWKVDRLPA